MLDTSDSQLLCDIPAEEISSALTKLLSSRTFKSAQGQSKFLAYAVTQFIAGRSELIKEYWIGREALGRGDAFDPRHDPIVRTQARKLRLRLAKYYQTEGVEDPICIEFPKGSYIPVFQRAQLPAEPRTQPAVEAEASISHNPSIPVPPEVVSVAAAEVEKTSKATSLVRNSMAFGIPIGVVGVAIAVAIYRWLST